MFIYADDDLPPAPRADGKPWPADGRDGRPARRADDGPPEATAAPARVAATNPRDADNSRADALNDDATALPPALLRLLSIRGPVGVTPRDVLRARLAPTADDARELLDGLTAAGLLTVIETRPARGGKVQRAYHRRPV